MLGRLNAIEHLHNRVNEEDYIAKCLDSCIEISSEIILVYNDCIDRTVSAKSKGSML